MAAEEAKKIIARLLKKAAGTRGRQLDAAQSGILAVGGFHVGRDALDALEAAATAALTDQRGRKEHLAAVAVSELSDTLTPVADSHGGGIRSHLQPTLETRLVRHPGYGGGLKISDRPVWATDPAPRGA